MSTKISIQNTGELEQLRLDLGVQSIALQAPSTNTEDCTQYEMYSEEWKQCMCEHDPANCPDDVLYFFHSDQLGSSNYLTDAEGNPYQFFIYLPWGEVLAEQKAAEFSTPYQFNGKELDQETGLYNYGARYYDPSLSLWLGVDPLADQFAGYSPYNYTLNNPINMIDPDGRAAVGTDGTDDWILRAGIIEYDASIHSAKDAFMTYGGCATYLGSAGTIEDASGRLNLNENGTSFFLPSPSGETSSDLSNKSSKTGSIITFEGVSSAITLVQGSMTLAGVVGDGFEGFDKNLKGTSLAKLSTIGSVAGFAMTLHNTKKY